MMGSKTQIFGDGKNVAFIWKEDGNKAEMAYIFKDAIVNSIEIHQEMMPEVPLVFWEKKVIEGYQPSISPVDVNLNLKCLPGDTITEFSNQGGLLQNLDMFKNISVSKMFQIINKKLKNREENKNGKNK